MVRASKTISELGSMSTSSSTSSHQEQVPEIFFQVLAEKRKEDPLIGPKLGSQEILQRLLEAGKTERGVHAESLLCLLGSLAGFACQISVRMGYQLDPATMQSDPLIRMDGVDGKHYFFGDAINRPLAESQYSVWSLAAATAQDLGCSDLPDVNDIFKHVTTSVGTDQFGLSRIDKPHTPGETPISYVSKVWPHIYPIAARFCDKPAELPILFGLAIQQAMIQCKTVLDARLALQIVMESAIPMSKIDPASIDSRFPAGDTNAEQAQILAQLNKIVEARRRSPEVSWMRVATEGMVGILLIMLTMVLFVFLKISYDWPDISVTGFVLVFGVVAAIVIIRRGRYLLSGGKTPATSRER
jgi:hypothetical protein